MFHVVTCVAPAEVSFCCTAAAFPLFDTIVTVVSFSVSLNADVPMLNTLSGIVKL